MRISDWSSDVCSSDLTRSSRAAAMKAASVAAPYPVPNRPVTVVTGKRCERLGPEEARSDRIGLKAMGLLRIPQPWVPDFFVVSSDNAPTASAISAASRTVGLQTNSQRAGSGGRELGGHTVN